MSFLQQALFVILSVVKSVWLIRVYRAATQCPSSCGVHRAQSEWHRARPPGNHSPAADLVAQTGRAKCAEHTFPCLHWEMHPRTREKRCLGTLVDRTGGYGIENPERILLWWPNSPMPPQLLREIKVVLISLIQFFPLSSSLLELWRSVLSVKNAHPNWFVFS